MKHTRTMATVKNFVAKHSDAFTERYIRYLIQNSKERKATINGEPQLIEPNGFAEAIVRVGNRVFIDEESFFQIIEHKQNRGGDAA